MVNAGKAAVRRVAGSIGGPEGLLVGLLWCAFVVLIPWTKLKFAGRIIAADLVFLGIVFFVGLRVVREGCKAIVLDRTILWYALLAGLWIVGLALSSIHAQHQMAYLLELSSICYGVAIGGLVVIVGGRSGDHLAWLFRFAAVSAAVVVAFGLIGSVYGVTVRQSAPFFTSAVKLIASFRNPNQLAAFSLIVLAFAWEGAWAHRDRLRVLFGFIVFSLPWIIMETCSRTGIAVAGIGGAAYYAHHLRKREWEPVYVLSFGLLLAGGLLIAVKVFNYGIPGSKPAVNLFNGIFRDGEVVDAFRVENWQLGLQLFREHPLFGVGLGYVAATWEYEIHNSYIALLAETGIVGFSTFLALIAYVLRTAWRNIGLVRRWKPEWTWVARGAFAAILFELGFGAMHIVHRSRHLWFLVGLVLAMYVVARTAEARKGEPRVRDLRPS